MEEAKIKREQRGMKTAELPTEIIFSHLLTRVPVKSLVKFRCVCKSWLFLLTRDTSFARLHQQTYIRSHILISSWIRNSSELHLYSAPIHQDATLGPSTHLLTLSLTDSFFYQSLNGLLFIHHANFLYPHNKGGPKYIFNPSTRELISLPRDDPHDIGGSSILVSYHFGLNPLTNEYKVLFLTEVRGIRPYRLECQIFGLGTSSWRRIDPIVPFDPCECSFIDSICVNGAIHWLRRFEKFIAVFNLGNECFRSLPIPEGYCNHDNLDFCHLIQVGGCLALIGDKHLLTQNLMELWILKDYQNQVWIKESISFPFDWEQSQCPIPKGTIHSGELLLPFCSDQRTSASVLLYDMSRMSFRRAEWMLPEDPGGKSIVMYEESLMALMGKY